MTKRVAVVTGANKGIGLSIVKLLVQRGFDGDVILTARDLKKGNSAAEKLFQEFNVAAKVHQLDIDDAGSIQKLKRHLQTVYGGLDVLVNNAGVAIENDKSTTFAEQAELTVKTNFFGTLSVFEILYPILRPGARVVHVTSSSGHLSKIHSKELFDRFARAKTNMTIEQLRDLMNEFVAAAKNGTAVGLGWSDSSYENSKVGVSALAFIHQRLFDKDYRDDLIVNGVHPGYVDTDLTEHQGRLTTDEGADAPTYLALLPPKDSSNPKGQYVWYTKEVIEWASNDMPDDS